MPWHNNGNDLFDLEDNFTFSNTGKTLVYDTIKKYPGMNLEGIVSYITTNYTNMHRDKIIDAISELEKNKTIQYLKSAHGYYIAK